MDGHFVEECFLEVRHVGGRFVLASDTQTLNTQGNTLTAHHTVGYLPPRTDVAPSFCTPKIPICGMVHPMYPVFDQLK